MVEPMGFESTSGMETKEFCGALWPSKELKGMEGILIAPLLHLKICDSPLSDSTDLLLKLGIRLSPRTVRRYMPSRPPRPKQRTQGWTTFVRNHARSVLASDFFVVVTATFRSRARRSL